MGIPPSKSVSGILANGGYSGHFAGSIDARHVLANVQFSTKFRKVDISAVHFCAGFHEHVSV